MSVASSDVLPSSSSIIITPETNLTPDEKRDLLFNVSRSLEIPMEDFDVNWWPLVSNVWTQWNSYKQLNGDCWKVFACCFMKHQVKYTTKGKHPK